MSIALVTGSAGLVGSGVVRHFAQQGLDVIGIDNDMRRYFFGDSASTAWNRQRLTELVNNYVHEDTDIRNSGAIEALFSLHGRDIAVVVHTAAQPSHDWAAREPHTDFTINALGTLNLLEATRKHAPEAPFIFCSTNKVYGDAPNELPLIETELRWELDGSHPYAMHGIDETMRIDQSTHSVFGASKVAADVMVQEYGRYFGLKTACFRGGCLTGPDHSGATLHGFLAYLMKCAVTGEAYTVLGYKGKQVRDNIHVQDLVNMFWAFFQAPRCGEVYNTGGSRYSNCSMLEAIRLCEEITGRPMNWSYSETNRVGDHIWWISDMSKFQNHYPEWHQQYDIRTILNKVHDGVKSRVLDPVAT